MKKSDKIKSGITALDNMLKDGLQKGSATLIAGNPGIDKTLFGIYFLKEGLESSEKCIYISLIKNPLEVLNKYSISFNWRKHLKKGSLIILSSKIPKIGKLIPELKKIFKKSEIQRIVIDGIFLAIMEKNNVTGDFDAIFDLIKQNKITSFLLGILKESNQVNFGGSLIPEMADNIIIIKQAEYKNSITRLLYVLKSTGALFDKDIKQMETENNKIIIKEYSSQEPVILADNEAILKIGNRINEYTYRLIKNNPHGIKIQEAREMNTPEKCRSMMTGTENQLDIAYIPYYKLMDFAKEGLFYELDNVFDKNKYFKPAIEGCSHNGSIYGVPDSLYCEFLVYRKDLLEKYRVKVPETWDELIDSAKYILRKENDSELSGFYPNWYNDFGLCDRLMEFLWSNNGDIIDEKGDLSINNNVIKESLEFMLSMIYKHKIIREEVLDYDIKKIRETTLNGRNIFATANAFRLENSELYNNNKLWIAPLPKMRKDCKEYIMDIFYAFCVNKNTKNLDYAIPIIKQLADEKLRRKMEIERGVPFPSIPSLWEDEKILSVHPYYLEAGKIVKNCRNISHKVDNYFVIAELISNKIYRVLKNKMGTDQALEQLEIDVQKTLKMRNKYGRITREAIALMENNISKKITLQDISNTVKISPRYLEKIFKTETGILLFDYFIDIRITKAKELIREGKKSIKEIAVNTGFKDLSNFYKIFKKETGSSPKDYIAR